VRLKSYLDAADVNETDRVCQMCRGAALTFGKEGHLQHDSHIDNLATTMNYVCKNGGASLQHVSGEKGPRVQIFRGPEARVWFNHITGESGTTALLDYWRRGDERDGRVFWYNCATHEHFEVFDKFGVDKGLWSMD